jgi:hypothetical protein
MSIAVQHVFLLGALLTVVTAQPNRAEANMADAGDSPGAQAQVVVRSLLCDKPLTRVGRQATVTAVIGNTGGNPTKLEVTLGAPEGVRLVGEGTKPRAVRLDVREERELRWRITADKAVYGELRLEIRPAEGDIIEVSVPMRFLPSVDVPKTAYIPEPQPVETSVLIGAHHCPLWEADKPGMWANVLKHPERTPALGFYAQETPEVSDWETKWAVEHGVSFFVYCWYRASQGGPVEMRFGSAIHDALFKSEFADKMKFTIMWENQARGRAGVADEKDLMENLLPFWMENYFKHPSYLKIDDKPVLFIYRPEFLIDDLGSVENVVRAFDKMRQACRDEGFAGLHLLGEYRGLDPKHLTLMKQLGLDYTFAYCWHVPNSPTPQQAIDAQMGYIRKTQELSILPQVVTVSQAWSGWHDEGSIWKIPPADYERLLGQAKDFVSTLPEGELGSRMLLLDNWNEWGEGHYIAPYREYGFGYLDAVRKLFSDAPREHLDLIPEDLGMGPYDRAYWAQMQREQELRRLLSRKALKPGAPEEGLIGWWAFDEGKGSPVALDYSGNRLGGKLKDAERTAGIDGKALVCDGGSVVVESDPRLSPATALTIECWVKTDVAGQGNTWMVNRVFGGGTSTGYRLGVLEGKPCFEVPLTDWSHHLTADTDLPTGRWVHLAGTFDGDVMRIYVDGREHGTMERRGPINANGFHLCLGNYEVDHAAHFVGLLDEVRLYDRALPADEIASHAAALRNKG